MRLMLSTNLFNSSGHMQIVQILLIAGADPKRKSQSGKTALIYAVQSGNLKYLFPPNKNSV